MATRPSTDPQQVPPGSILLVIHDFIARSPDELSLSKGDRIELVERDDDFGDGWFLGRHMNNGNTGLFPEVYTTPAPKGTLNQPPAQRASVLAATQAAAQASAGAALTTSNVAQLSKRPTSEDGSNLQARTFNGNKTRHSADAVSQSPIFPLAQSASRTSLPPSASRTSTVDEGSSEVMNETLSVIDEHITDMHAPKRGATRAVQNGNGVPNNSRQNRSEPRMSLYINGHETDEEEGFNHTEVEVSQWTPTRVAEYLEDHGVEKQHCDVFREQEISGDVILSMEQSAIFIKEFELGSVGRRLKTWQKIKALQDEARAHAAPAAPRSVSDYSATAEPEEVSPEAGRNRSSSLGDMLPKVAASQERPTSFMSPNRNTSMPVMTEETLVPAPARTVPAPTLRQERPESIVRPSAASIRSYNHSRRHSSMDSKMSAHELPATKSHRKQASLDRAWSSGPANDNTRRLSAVHQNTFMGTPRGSQQLDWNTTFINSPSPADDRGYFSDADARNHRRSVLQKRQSTAHTRNISAASDSGRQEPFGNAAYGSTTMDLVSPMTSNASASRSRFGKFTSFRSSSNPKPTFGKPVKELDSSVSPVVTKLDYPQGPKEATSPGIASSDTSSIGNSPNTNNTTTRSMGFFQKHKNTSMRVASDAVTPTEKQFAAKGSPLTSPTRTGSTTPSTDRKSSDLQKSDIPSRVSTGSSSNLAPAPPPPPPQSSSRLLGKTRSKQSTSAYTRGLEKKPPAEQMADCDYSGWMKKKSSALMGTWKPRLFVLRGRRLSYYYDEDDTEEKGLIDISAHRVLPASKELLTGLHAQVTGAKSSNAAPSNTTTQTNAAYDLANKPPESPSDEQSGLFIFKLVPPRTGMSKAVNFTKPMVHYFAVNSRREGRLWMAALMKATIDYDANGKVVTSYNQTTISLAKARARNERPPALKEVEDKQAKAEPDMVGGAVGPVEDAFAKGERAELDGDGNGNKGKRPTSLGLGISNAGGEQQDGEPNGGDATLAGAESMTAAPPSRPPPQSEDTNSYYHSGLESLHGSIRKKEAFQLIS